MKHEDLIGNIHGGVNIFNSALSTDDDNGHGTLIAGIIAARQNGKGVVGIAPYAQLFNIKAFSKDGKGKVTNVIKAIDWSINNKIQIINISSSFEKDNQEQHNEIKKAAKAGILIVAAATDNSDNAGYPARYPEVISVGSVNEQNKIMYSLGKHNNEIDIYSPDTDIYSTALNNTYQKSEGNSMAAAHITGILAVILSNPKKIDKVVDHKEALERLIKTGFTYEQDGEPYIIANCYNAINMPLISTETQILTKNYP